MFKSAHMIIHKDRKQIDFNINKYLNNKESLETFIKHEYEQLTYIDSDIDEIRILSLHKSTIMILESYMKK